MTTRRPYYTTQRPYRTTRRTYIPREPRVTSTTPGYGEDAAEKMPPTEANNGDMNAVIAGVTCGIMGVILLSLAIYLFVLRKKLKTVRKGYDSKSLIRYNTT